MKKPKLLLFDVDGTLLKGYGGGLRAMTHAGRRVFGEAFSLSGVDRLGRIDPQIVAAALVSSGLEATEGQIEVFRRHYLEELRTEVKSARPLPGTLDLLDRLRAVDGVVLGLVTGNYREAARIKLFAVRIDPTWFAVAGFGEDAATRSGLVRRAIDDAATRLGRSIAGADVVVIGDTPRDVQSARANGCAALAVATGEFDLETLRAAGPDVVLPDLTDPTALWAMLQDGE